MKILVLSVLLVFVIFSVANAELFNRGTDSLGNRLIYDDDRNITWYDYSFTFLKWQVAIDTVSALSVNYGENIYNDWRLPNPYSPAGGSYCYDYNCTESEMGHLYYIELGNKGYYSTSRKYQPDYGLKNKGDFQNLYTTRYWVGTEDDILGEIYDGGILKIFVPIFDAYDGKQDENPNYWLRYSAIAVRDGDVIPPVVPEPISSTLFVVGGFILALRKYQRKKK